MKSRLLLSVILCIMGAGGGLWAEALRFDFESGKLDHWEVVEGSFGKLVTDLALFHWSDKPYNKQGTYFLSTLEDPNNRTYDRYVGVVESDFFVLTGTKASFLLGGGNQTTVYLALCTADNREFLVTTGKNSQTMREVTWEIPAELIGQPVCLRIVDHRDKGWGHLTFDDFQAEGHIVPEPAGSFKAIRRRRQSVRKALAGVNVEATGAAIRDLAQTFPETYPGKKMLAEFATLEQRLSAVEAAFKDAKCAFPDNAEELGAEFAAFARRALLANPLVRQSPIIFVSRHQYRRDHHNTATLFQTDECNTKSFEPGGGLKLFDPETCEVRSLVDPGPTGVARDPDVYFDGSKILFSMRRSIEDDYHIYEVQGDGTGLKQLTGAPHVADIDPIYLPDDTIVFSSTREPKYCMCNIHIMANVHRMDGDGANIHQIGKSTLFEGHNALLPDGRILYYRWEYVDRNFGDAQGLWTVNPDGTNHAIYWGNNTSSPGGAIDPRPIPNTQSILCILGSCHDRPWGAMAVLDRRKGIDATEADRASLVRTWPANAIELAGSGNYDRYRYVRPRYEDPFPLNENYYLCSRELGADAAGLKEKAPEMGIYLVDVFGNELLLHAEAPGCYDPMPLAPRNRPPVVPSRRDFQDRPGTFYVVDVYQGTHMDGVKRGDVKYLRVVESPEKRFWTRPAWGGQGVHRPAMNWHNFENKRILGTVPVEPDGSAHFDVPADTFVFFQLLDKDRMMIASMRTGTIAQSGETTGCVGCHENRRTAPILLKQTPPLATQRPADKLEGWHGPPRLFSFMQEVQPVFDKHCVSCHDFGKKAGKKLNLAGDRTLFFNVAYQSLYMNWQKPEGSIKTVGAGPSAVQPAYSWGAHASRLVKKIRGGHANVRLSDEEMDRIVTWLDINAPYYPSYASAYPDNLVGRSPLDDKQLKRLKELTGVDFTKVRNHRANKGALVTFDRPELSPCLAGIEDKSSAAFREAIDIIAAGRDMLAKHPRADMPGFQYCDEHQRRERKYEHRRDEEHRSRLAIREGRKVYDEGVR